MLKAWAVRSMDEKATLLALAYPKSNIKRGNQVEGFKAAGIRWEVNYLFMDVIENFCIVLPFTFYWALYLGLIITSEF